MKFAKIVFYAAGVWGIALLSAVFLVFDAAKGEHASAIVDPMFYFGFLTVTMAWQLAFLVIGSDPVRFRPLMIPSIAEKMFFVVAMIVLYGQGRVTQAEATSVVPDFVLGVLFTMSFVKTAALQWAPDRSAARAPARPAPTR